MWCDYFHMTSTIELTKFRILPDKHELTREWMNFLNENKDACCATLIDEQIDIETIFIEYVGNEMFLYWYTIQRPGGILLEQSQHAVDKKHFEYMKACVDYSEYPTTLSPALHLTPPRK